MARIESLTPEQAARVPVFRAEYLAAGLNTAPADRPRAEAAFARAYRRIGRKPVPVIWVDSPLAASLAFAALKDLALRDSLQTSLGVSLGVSLADSLRDNLGVSLPDSLADSIWDSLGDSLWDSIWDSLRDSLADSLQTSLQTSLQASLGDILGDNLRASLWDSLQISLWASLGASLGVSLWDSLRDSKIEPEFTYWWGQQDLYWVAYYRFFLEIGVDYKQPAVDGLDIMNEIGMSCMWWYPRDGMVIACERPSAIHVDERGRLHNDSGPAVLFRDGWAIHAIHGVRVPGHLVEHPEATKLQEIVAEQNSEIQRVMIERFGGAADPADGWARYMEAVNPEIVDHDDRWGTLLRAPGGLALRVVNRSPEPDGTFRQYVLAVSDGCEPLPDPADPGGELGSPQALTALNAVASTFGLTGREYAEMLTSES